MAFDPGKDVIHKSWMVGEELRVSIAAYNGGDPKIGLNRVRTKANGDEIVSSSGRLTLEEYEALVELHPSIVKVMKKVKAKAQQKGK